MADAPADPIAGINVAIVVFAMHGCPACKDYLPRFYRQVEGYQKLGVPFVIFQEGMQLKRGDIPVLVYDSQSDGAGVQELANLHNVTALPTTLIMPKVGFAAKYEGGLNDREIYNVLNLAVLANR